jgi:type IV pilus assembly protein PilQ
MTATIIKLNRTSFGRFVAASVLLVFTATTYAGQVEKLEWRESGDEPELSVKLSSKPSSHEVKSFDNGRRLRLILGDTQPGASIADLQGSGIVKGVYTYVASDGTSTNIDFLMNEPGGLDVDAGRGEYRIKVARAAGDKAAAAAPARGNAIQDLLFTKMPGGRVQITVKMGQTPAAPDTFTISKPARLSFDFAGTAVEMEKKSVAIKTGAVDTVNVVSAADRARVVVSLYEAAAYTSTIAENAYVITVESPAGKAAAEAARESRTTHFAGAAAQGKHQIKNIDFRREPDGGAKVLVTLSDPATGIDIKEQAGEILVDFIDTVAPASLQKRLDVIDFGTPVQTVDTYTKGRNTRIVITPQGPYEHLAYQAGDVFTVNIKPVKKDEKAEKEKKAGDEFGYTGEKLSLNFQRIDVRDALQVLADFTGLNFIISDTVTGNLTLRLKDVPWDQALDIILDSRKLGMRQKGNVIIIAPSNELAAQEKAQLEAKKTVRELEPLTSELLRINYAKASDIAALLKSVKAVETGISSTNPFQTVTYAGEQKVESNSLLSERGQVTVDTRTNSILIQDTPSKIREVRKLIAQLDQPVEQVLIEARLVEATSTFAKSLGARLGTAAFPAGGTSAYSGNLEGNVTMFNAGVLNANTDGLNVNLPSPGIGTSLPGQLAVTLFDGTNLLQLELSALEQEGQGKIISSPRIITANQQKAMIEQGQERSFSLGSGQSKIQTAVLSLEVTPQITPDRRIILDVVVTKDNFADVAAGLINKKRVETNVLLDNGQTVAIGGIYEQDNGNQTTQVPVLGRLPMLGWAFKNKASNDNKTELLVFLTPRILSDNLNLR